MPIFTLEATGAISILNVFRLNTSDVCAVMCYNDVRVSARTKTKWVRVKNTLCWLCSCKWFQFADLHLKTERNPLQQIILGTPLPIVIVMLKF